MMRLILSKDYFDSPKPPEVYLCDTSKKIIGELPAYDASLDGKWNAYSELQFTIDRQYTDILTGETQVNPLFDKVEGLRKVYVKNIGYFVIQDPDTVYSDKDSKTLTCFSSEYETGSKYLENFRVNTGDVDSKEVIYLATIYGENYTIDTPYKPAVSGEYDEYGTYYIREYTDSDSYTYEQIQISDQSSYQSHFGSGANAGIPLYVPKYPNVRFYYPSKPELSLLHLIFEKIPDWSIGHVDATLWRKERKFDEDRIAVYDFLMNDMSQTFKCVVEWDTIQNKVNFYEEAEDGINEDNTIQTRFDTDVFIGRENLANEINIKYSSDDIKTKLKVSGAENLDIREVNLGKNYIMNLDYFHTMDWMEQDLFEAYQDYLDAVEKYSPLYTEAMQGWVAAYNKWDNLMNAVPAQGGVILVGDVFEKLYCIYTVTADTSMDAVLSALTKKLTLYKVNEDLAANKTDNILLRLKNSNSDIATIRIYNSGTKALPEYTIQIVIINATSGIESDPIIFTMKQWVNGDINIEHAQLKVLKDYKVNYIGTMGAYFVLAKDEKKKENLQDYGIKLLQEKQVTYTTIFQTQTEQMFSDEDYQCIASNEPPTGVIAENTRWLDTDTSPVKLYVYTSGEWVEFEGDLSEYENYARYKENYDKLVAVQEVLVEKETKAEYLLNGYAVSGRRIDVSQYRLDTDGVWRLNGQSLESAMQGVAQSHFSGHTIARLSMDSDRCLYTFTTSKYPDDTFVVYLNGTIPYVSYVGSRGMYQSQMNYINHLTDLEQFFTADQWARLSPLIREDEFTDDNFLLTGYESEEERLNICRELMNAAAKELKTLSQPSLEFSMTMANILALPEFESLTSQFQLGNFVRVHIRDGYVKRARLLEVHFKFDDLSDFSATFGNLVTTKSEIDKHAELLKQAVTAGKQVATAAGEWQKAVDKSNALEEAIANGLQDAALAIGKASGQSITWNEQGIRCRKLIDGTTDQYEDAQIAIINNKIVFTDDAWETSKAALGEFTITLNGVEQNMYGLLADAVVSGYIEGSIIKGGSLEIGGNGGKFVVHEDGSVQILGPDSNEIYASKTDVSTLQGALQYSTKLTYNGSTIFSDPNSSCTITCTVYYLNEDITSKLPAGTTYSWIRNSNANDAEWNATHANQSSNSIIITNKDVEKNAQFSCTINFDEEQLKL